MLLNVGLLSQEKSISGVFLIKPDNATITFGAKHFGVLNVKGDFGKFSGKITFENNVIRSAEVSVVVSSISTSNNSRDQSLKNENFLDAKKYPIISVWVTTNKNPEFILAQVRIKNVSNDMKLKYKIEELDSYYKLTVDGILSRESFDLEFGQMDGLVSDEIKFSGIVILPYN